MPVELHERDVGADDGEHVEPFHRARMRGLPWPDADLRPEAAGGLIVPEVTERHQRPVFLSGRAHEHPLVEERPRELGQ